MFSFNFCASTTHHSINLFLFLKKKIKPYPSSRQLCYKLNIPHSPHFSYHVVGFMGSTRKWLRDPNCPFSSLRLSLGITDPLSLGNCPRLCPLNPPPSFPLAAACLLLWPLRVHTTIRPSSPLLAWGRHLLFLTQLRLHSPVLWTHFPSLDS